MIALGDRAGWSSRAAGVGCGLLLMRRSRAHGSPLSCFFPVVAQPLKFHQIRVVNPRMLQL